MFGLSGARLRLIGVVALLAGLVLFLGSTVLPFLAIQGVTQDPFNPSTPVREVGFGSPVAQSPDVRVKCRNCGYLETEDAEFCSKCGQRL